MGSFGAGFLHGFVGSVVDGLHSGIPFEFVDLFQVAVVDISLLDEFVFHKYEHLLEHVLELDDLLLVLEDYAFQFLNPVC